MLIRQLIARYVLYGRALLVVPVIWLLIVTLTGMSMLVGFARRLLAVLLLISLNQPGGSCALSWLAILLLLALLMASVCPISSSGVTVAGAASGSSSVWCC